MRTRRLAVTLTALVTLIGLSACGGSSDPMADSSGGGSADSGNIIVGSANFPENQLLAELYAGALEAKGVSVTKQLNISSRETYLGALKDGSIDLIPEYTGNLARYYDPEADVSSTEAALASLKRVVPDGLTVLEPAPAEDKDSVVVTQATAEKYSLTSIGDLASHASQMILGGPPEWKQRIDGVPGLKRVYGLEFASFKPLDAAGALTVQALDNGQVDAANLFSTNPEIAAKGFVVLDDPKGLFGSQNIIPLINKDKATATVTETLNAVDATLDTKTLTDLVAKVVIDNQDADAVAAEYLSSKSLK